MMPGSVPHLTKVIMNLIINAYDAMPDGGTVEIATEHRNLKRLLGGHDQIEPGHYILLRVQDTGVGIPADQIELVFEPF